MGQGVCAGGRWGTGWHGLRSGGRFDGDESVCVCSSGCLRGSIRRGLPCRGNGLWETMPLCALFCPFEETHERGGLCDKYSKTFKQQAP